MGVVLVTGGAGFIGTHLVTRLVQRGFRVRVLDAFVEQVHGLEPASALDGAEVVRGDVRDRDLLRTVLDDVEVVFHQAAEVGVGQSMYDIERYVSANTLGTAVLLEQVVERADRIRKLIVASSMSIYGEGAYICDRCGPVSPGSRPAQQLLRRDWELHCPTCDAAVRPLATPESKPLIPTSVYAITKQDQEQLSLTVCRAYGIPAVALRYFNVYGSGQALSNPYTGVAAIFSSRILNGESPLVFEDGAQSRDFVHVSDIVDANLLALESTGTAYEPINIGTGVPTSVRRMAELLARGLGTDIEATTVGRYREGDIRHCFADVARAERVLGFRARVRLEEGIPQLLDWVREQRAVDGVARATGELDARGLIR